MQGRKLRKLYSVMAGDAKQILAEMNIDASASGPESLARIVARVSGRKLKKTGTAYYMRFVVQWVASRSSTAAVKVYAPYIASNKKWEQTPDFLKSKEWKALRYQALVAHGGRCQCCGASASDGVRLNVDHIFPRSTHPWLALELDNLQVLCSSCNEGKSNIDTTDWRPLARSANELDAAGGAHESVPWRPN